MNLCLNNWGVTCRPATTAGGLTSGTSVFAANPRFRFFILRLLRLFAAEFSPSGFHLCAFASLREIPRFFIPFPAFPL
jgi:hypothetical protein